MQVCYDPHDSSSTLDQIGVEVVKYNAGDLFLKYHKKVMQLYFQNDRL